MLRFENIEYLYALLMLPVFMVMYLLFVLWKNKALKRYGDLKVTRQLMPYMSKDRKIIKFILLMASWVLLVIGLANPQIGSRLEKVERKGADLMIALDVSNSMLAQDIRPDRLTRAKQAISRLVDKLSGDRIGIIVFAGRAYTQLPITSDYAAAKMFLSSISTEIVPVQGTAIGDAIELASGSFKDDTHSKVIIIITDGENNEGDALQAATETASEGIRIYTIGMGLADGAPIPMYNQHKQITGYKKDKKGTTVISKLDETMLQQIASAGNGVFVMANNQRDGLDKVLQEIDMLDKTEFETQMFSDYEDRFQYFIGFAIFLLILEFLIFERKSKLAAKIKLFSR